MALSARISIVFLVSFAITIPCLHSGIAEYDDYLKKEAANAQEASLEAYDPHPENITDEFNAQVRRITLSEEGNSTRRNLGSKKYKGPCKATNPIDICWRCKGDWSKDRKKLAKCVMGFGHKTTGGLKGRYYVVTESSDNNVVNPRPGTLRHAVQQKEPLWIIFARSMMIKLKKELLVSSDKTIDGRGANVQIAHGAGISVQFAKNVIIHNLRIHDTVRTEGGLIRDSASHVGIRTTADGDGISIFASSNIWIDHVSMSNCADGLIDVVQGSTGVTISNCHFTKHNDVMLFGASDTNSMDKIMQITVAFNHFGKGLIQRMPRCRWGFFHVVNNDYTHWLMYAIGGSSGPTIISQGNRFIAPPNRAANEITHRHYAPPAVWKKWQWISQKDLLMNGAKFIQSGPPLKKNAFANNKQMITPQDGTAVTWLTRFSGAIKCVPGKPC